MYPWLASSRDGKRHAGDVVGLLRSKIEYRVCDIGRYADAAQRRGADGAVLQMLDGAEAGTCPLGLDRPGRHGVDGHAILGELERNVAREAVDGGLCRGVGRVA